MTAPDPWSQWLLHGRFGGDPGRMQAVLEVLYPVRDRVLENARLGEGETLLDVGCGDGLIAFGALEKVPSAGVIFSDISQDLLDRCRALAADMGLLGRCRFLRAAADDLSDLPQGSLDAVTTRSVLIYVEARAQAFAEFYRLLRPGGRLSIFEPINRFCYPEPPDRFMGYDVTPVAAAVDKVKAVFARLQPAGSDPMLNFDERDLLALAETAGFREIHLELRAEIRPPRDRDWERLLHTPGNPRIPDLAQAMQHSLTPAEAAALAAHLRPLVEAGQGVSRSAVAYLWAAKGQTSQVFETCEV